MIDENDNYFGEKKNMKKKINISMMKIKIENENNKQPIVCHKDSIRFILF